MILNATAVALAPYKGRELESENCIEGEEVERKVRRERNTKCDDRFNAKCAEGGERKVHRERNTKCVKGFNAKCAEGGGRKVHRE